MKKIELFIVLLICLFIVNVKADMGPPVIASHEVVVTNKNGAQCYDSDGKKESSVIPYGTTLIVHEEITGSFINVYDSEDFKCIIKYADIGAKD